MYTITLSGNSSELSCELFPPLEVKKTSRLCLLSLQTNNSIPNIEPGCNKIGFIVDGAHTKTVTLPTGSYELTELETLIQSLLPIEVNSIKLQGNKNTLKCKMTCSNKIDFTVEDSIAKLLGFEKTVYADDEIHESPEIVNIMKVNCIKVDCNLIKGSFFNGYPGQTIHEFSPTVKSGYKIIEIPRHPVYYALNYTSVSEINIKLLDQDDNLINLRGEPITIRIHIIHDDGA